MTNDLPLLSPVAFQRSILETESPHFQLIFRDEDRDFALFARTPMEGKDVCQGQIDVDRLFSALLSSFPDVFAERCVFTIGYELDCKRECFVEALESAKRSLESE